VLFVGFVTEEPGGVFKVFMSIPGGNSGSIGEVVDNDGGIRCAEVILERVFFIVGVWVCTHRSILAKLVMLEGNEV